MFVGPIAGKLGKLLHNSGSIILTYRPTIPAHIAIAAFLLMAPGFVSGTFGRPVSMSMVLAHQPLSSHGKLSMTVAIYLMSPPLRPSLWKMYAPLAVYQPKAGGPPPAIDSPPPES